MEDVARYPRLQRRGAVYHLRVKVPQDLIAAVGKREIKRSLRTTDKATAVRALYQASAEIDASFATHRRVLATDPQREAGRAVMNGWLLPLSQTRKRVMGAHF